MENILNQKKSRGSAIAFVLVALMIATVVAAFSLKNSSRKMEITKAGSQREFLVVGARAHMKRFQDNLKQNLDVLLLNNTNAAAAVTARNAVYSEVGLTATSDPNNPSLSAYLGAYARKKFHAEIQCLRNCNFNTSNSAMPKIFEVKYFDSGKTGENGAVRENEVDTAGVNIALMQTWVLANNTVKDFAQLVLAQKDDVTIAPGVYSGKVGIQWEVASSDPTVPATPPTGVKVRFNNGGDPIQFLGSVYFSNLGPDNVGVTHESLAPPSFGEDAGVVYGAQPTYASDMVTSFANLKTSPLKINLLTPPPPSLPISPTIGSTRPTRPTLGGGGLNPRLPADDGGLEVGDEIPLNHFPKFMMLVGIDQIEAHQQETNSFGTRAICSGCTPMFSQVTGTITSTTVYLDGDYVTVKQNRSFTCDNPRYCPAPDVVTLLNREQITSKKVLYIPGNDGFTVMAADPSAKSAYLPSSSLTIMGDGPITLNTSLLKQANSTATHALISTQRDIIVSDNATALNGTLGQSLWDVANLHQSNVTDVGFKIQASVIAPNGKLIVAPYTVAQGEDPALQSTSFNLGAIETLGTSVVKELAPVNRQFTPTGGSPVYQGFSKKLFAYDPNLMNQDDQFPGAQIATSGFNLFVTNESWEQKPSALEAARLLSQVQ